MLVTSTLPATSQRSPDAPAEPPQLKSIAHIRRYGRDQSIYSPEDRSDTWYRVISGSARKYLTRPDGHRHLVDFYLPGDLFGFTCRAYRSFAVQAVADETLIACYARQRVEALAEEDYATAREIRAQSFEALRRLEQQVLVIGTVTAQEKVRRFLLCFQDRFSTGTEGDLTLPISRYDIADMLGISAETVCRAFTDLRERGVISLHGPRHITIMQRHGR